MNPLPSNRPKLLQILSGYIMFASDGFTLYFRGEVKPSYKYLLKALELGEKTENQIVVGYACSWLPFTCGMLDLIDDAIGYGKRAHDISKILYSEQYLFFKSLIFTNTRIVFGGDLQQLIFDAAGYIEGFDKFGDGILIDCGVGAGQLF